MRSVDKNVAYYDVVNGSSVIGEKRCVQSNQRSPK